MFLTTSMDRTVRLWNVQQAGCMGQLTLPANTTGQPHCVFDSTGMVYAVTAAMAGGQGNVRIVFHAAWFPEIEFLPANSHKSLTHFPLFFVSIQYIHLYDARNFTGGAFSELQVSTNDLQQAMTTQRVAIPPGPITWKSIDFNLSGTRILVEADPGLAIVLDGYEGTVQRVFQSAKSKATSSCFTPDDQYVIMGTESGGVDCWNVQSGTVVKHLEGHLGPVGAVKCNPKYAQIASSCTSTCLWIW
jgi:COMPASS component SWD2